MLKHAMIVQNPAAPNAMLTREAAPRPALGLAESAGFAVGWVGEPPREVGPRNAVGV